MNKKERRLNELLGLLNEQPNLSVKNLASILNVSEMTIRRDLSCIKSNNRLDNINNIEHEYKLSEERAKYSAEKIRIGKFAVSLISPGDILIIDNGTTTGEMSKYIPENMGLTILCYNYYILSQLVQKNDVSIIFPGGYYHPKDQMFESPEANNLIKSHRATKLFLSASGVHEKLGITCAHNYEVLTKRAVISSSLTKILLVDSSKLGLIRTAFFASMSEIDIIITDSGISEEWIHLIEDAGIELHIV